MVLAEEKDFPLAYLELFVRLRVLLDKAYLLSTGHVVALLTVFMLTVDADAILVALGTRGEFFVENF